jgi:hypothetical protein
MDAALCGKCNTSHTTPLCPTTLRIATRSTTQREFNYCAIVVGLPGYGKSTLMQSLIRRHLLERTNGIVLAHDPEGQFTSSGCYFYPDAATYRRKALKAQAGGTGIPRGASIGGNSDDVVTLAMEIGDRANRATSVERPILLCFDEASLRDGSGSTWTGKADNELLSIRRHRGIGPVFNLQEAKQLSARFFRGTTDVYLFRQTLERSQELDGLCFLDKGTLHRAGVTDLEKFRYLHVRIGDGVVPDPL